MLIVWCNNSCLGVVAVLLLNAMGVFSVGGGALLDRPCMVIIYLGDFAYYVVG